MTPDIKRELEALERALDALEAEIRQNAEFHD